jgi:flagellar basal body-associated protein FliL
MQLSPQGYQRETLAYMYGCADGDKEVTFCLILELPSKKCLLITEASMNPDNIWPVVIVSAALVLLAQRILGSKKPRIFIPDYQRGVRFADGAFGRVLDPGSYQPGAKDEQTTIVDMRPLPVVVERVLYQDAIQTPSVISIAAEVLVEDPVTATTKLKNFANDSVAIIRDQLRNTVSKRIADSAPEVRSKLQDELASALNSELRKFGVGVRNVEVTELWSRAVKPAVTTGAN